MAQVDTIATDPVWAIPCPVPAAQFETLGRWIPVELVAEGPISRVFRACADRNKVSGGETLGDGVIYGKNAGENADERPACYALKVLRRRWQQDPKAVAL
ncbi:MAG: hypothetical protein JXM70_05405, partial [Pirellulales bacterium]|nr:hypothetical protein [Pirellulales bacterium]